MIRMNGTLVVGTVIALLIASAAISIAMDRRRGRCSCGYSCGACGRCGSNVEIEECECCEK